MFPDHLYYGDKDKLGQKVRSVFQQLNKLLYPPYDLVLHVVSEDEFVRYCCDNQPLLQSWTVSSVAEQLVQGAFTETDEFLAGPQADYLEEARILLFFKLAAVDGSVDGQEYEYLKACVEHAALDTEKKVKLLNLLQSEAADYPEVQLTELAHFPDQARALVLDMIGLAKANNILDVREKILIIDVADRLGIERQAVESLMTN